MEKNPQTRGGVVLLKILLVRLSAFGDIIHTLPALCALRRHYPEARIDWLVSRKCSDLLEDHPDIDGLHLLDRTPRGFLSMRRELQKEAFDVCIDFQGLIKSGVLTRLSGAPRRIGRHAAACRESLAAAFYTERGQPRKDHVIEQNIELVQALGVREVALRYRLALPMVDVPPPFDTRPIAINIGAAWPTKKYPLEKWAELARLIHDELRREVVIFWGPGEEQDAECVCRLAPFAVRAPKTTYRQMGRLLTCCAALVSSESGPLHLSIAVGVPCVCLIGVTDPKRNGPLDPRSKVVLPPAPLPWSYRRKGESPAGQIPVRDVFDKVQQVIEETP
jgi:heptosyltransferase I